MNAIMMNENFLNKLDDANITGSEIEFESNEAELLGAFQENSLSIGDVNGSLYDNRIWSYSDEK